MKCGTIQQLAGIVKDHFNDLNVKDTDKIFKISARNTARDLEDGLSGRNIDTIVSVLSDEQNNNLKLARQFGIDDVKVVDNIAQVIRGLINIDPNTSTNAYRIQNLQKASDRIGGLGIPDRHKPDMSREAVMEAEIDELEKTGEFLDDRVKIIGHYYSGGNITENTNVKASGIESENLYGEYDRFVDDMYNLADSVYGSTSNYAFRAEVSRAVDWYMDRRAGDNSPLKQLFYLFMSDKNAYDEAMQRYTDKKYNLINDYFREIKEVATLSAINKMNKKVSISSEYANRLEKAGIKVVRNKSGNYVNFFDIGSTNWSNKYGKTIDITDPKSGAIGRKTEIQERSIFQGKVGLEKLFNYMYHLKQNPEMINALIKQEEANKGIKELYSNNGVPYTASDIRQGAAKIQTVMKLRESIFNLNPRLFNIVNKYYKQGESIKDELDKLNPQERDIITKIIQKIRYNKENQGTDVQRSIGNELAKENSVGKAIFGMLNFVKQNYPGKTLNNLSDKELLEFLDKDLVEVFSNLRKILNDYRDNKIPSSQLEEKLVYTHKWLKFLRASRDFLPLSKFRELEEAADEGKNVTLSNGLKTYFMDRIMGSYPKNLSASSKHTMNLRDRLYAKLSPKTSGFGDHLQARARLERSKLRLLKDNTIANKKAMMNKARSKADKIRNSIDQSGESLGKSKVKSLEALNKLKDDKGIKSLRARLNAVGHSERRIAAAGKKANAKDIEIVSKKEALLKEMEQAHKLLDTSDPGYKNYIKAIEADNKISGELDEVRNSLAEHNREFSEHNIEAMADRKARRDLRKNKEFIKAKTQYDAETLEIAKNIQALAGIEFSIKDITDVMNHVLFRQSDILGTKNERFFPAFVEGDLAYVNTDGVLADKVTRTTSSQDLITSKYGKLPRRMLFRPMRASTGNLGQDQVQDVWVALDRFGTPIKYKEGGIMTFRDEAQIKYFIDDVRLAKVADSYYNQNMLMYSFKLNPNHATIELKNGGIRVKHVSETDRIKITIKDFNKNQNELKSNFDKGIKDKNPGRYQDNINKINAMVNLFQGKLKWRVSYNGNNIVITKEPDSLEIPKKMYTPIIGIDVIGKDHYTTITRNNFVVRTNRLAEGLGDSTKAMVGLSELNAFNRSRSVGGASGRGKKAISQNIARKDTTAFGDMKHKGGELSGATDVVKVRPSGEATLDITSADQNKIMNSVSKIGNIYQEPYIKRSVERTTNVYDGEGNIIEAIVRNVIETTDPYRVIRPNPAAHTLPYKSSTPKRKFFPGSTIDARPKGDLGKLEKPAAHSLWYPGRKALTDMEGRAYTSKDGIAFDQTDSVRRLRVRDKLEARKASRQYRFTGAPVERHHQPGSFNVGRDHGREPSEFDQPMSKEQIDKNIEISRQRDIESRNNTPLNPSNYEPNLRAWENKDILDDEGNRIYSDQRQYPGHKYTNENGIPTRRGLLRDLKYIQPTLKDIAGLPFMRDVDRFIGHGNKLVTDNGALIKVNNDGTISMKPLGKPGVVEFDGNVDVSELPQISAHVIYSIDNQSLRGDPNKLPKIYNFQSEWTDAKLPIRLTEKLKDFNVKVVQADIKNAVEIVFIDTDPTSGVFRDMTNVKGLSEAIEEVRLHFNSLYEVNLEEMGEAISKRINDSYSHLEGAFEVKSDKDIINLVNEKGSKEDLKKLMQALKFRQKLNDGTTFFGGPNEYLQNFYGAKLALRYDRVSVADMDKAFTRNADEDEILGSQEVSEDIMDRGERVTDNFERKDSGGGADHLSDDIFDTSF